MILGDELRELPGPQHNSGPDLAADLRKMALHLETAAVLELKARRTTDPGQVATLRRRAEQRRQQAARLRARLAAVAWWVWVLIGWLVLSVAGGLFLGALAATASERERRRTTGGRPHDWA